MLYAIRAPKVTQVKELYERACQIAQGAATMMQTTVEIRQVTAYLDNIGNDVIQDRLREHMKEGLPLDYTAEEMDYAASFRKVITELDGLNLKNLAKQIGGKESAKLLEMPIWYFLQSDKLFGCKTRNLVKKRNDRKVVSFLQRY